MECIACLPESDRSHVLPRDQCRQAMLPNSVLKREIRISEDEWIMNHDLPREVYYYELGRHTLKMLQSDSMISMKALLPDVCNQNQQATTPAPTKGRK